LRSRSAFRSPPTDPLFLAIVGIRVLFGRAALVSGAVAMLTRKGRGRHANYGTIYFWSMARTRFGNENWMDQPSMTGASRVAPSFDESKLRKEGGKDDRRHAYRLLRE
jgi:hypothetical protein